MISMRRHREEDATVIEAALLVSAVIAVFWAINVFVQTLHRA